MKKVLWLFACFSALSLFAVKVSDLPVLHSQPQGEQIKLLMQGDEYFHYLTDLHGYTVLIDSQTDAAVYAMLQGEKLIPSEHLVGKADPISLGLNPGLMPSRKTIESIAQANGSNSPSREGFGPTTGTINNLVIFVRFLDQAEYTQPLATYDTMFNSTTAASLRGFFLQESANQLTVNSTFYPAAVGGIVRSFQDGHARGYFSPHSASNTIGYNTLTEGKQRLWLMMQYAVNSIASSIPAGLDLDSDNDGRVDNIVFICQGPFDTRLDVLWPHHSNLWPYTNVSIGSLVVSDYNLQLSGSIDPGVLSHEYSHTMNFPDLYHYDNDLDPVGFWDTMAGTTNPPQHHTTYMKQKYGGWFTSIPEITPTATATQYTLTAIDQNPFSCYKIASTRPNEYYVIEYRRESGTYESGVPSSGLIVYRILSSYGGSALWGNPHGPPDELYVYRPGVNANSDNGLIDLASFSYQSGRTDIYTGTDPSPWLYGDGSAQLPGNLVIMDIGSSGGTTISFWIKNTSPNRWLGRAGTEWTEPLNWSHNAIPTVNDDVVVPPGYIYEAFIRVPNQACKSLIIKPGGELNIHTGSLEVADNLTSYGTLNLGGEDSALYVYDDMNLLSGSVTSVYTSQADISVEEDLRFGSGSSANWTLGYLEFTGSGASTITVESAVSINNLRIEKTGTGSCTISGSNTATLTINGSIYVNDGVLNHAYTGNTVLKGNLHAYTGGSLAFYNGTIRCEGSSSASIRFDTSGSYLHKLVIAKTGSAGISLSTSNIVVGSDLSIISGYFSCGGNTLTVGGNWTNSAGPDAFFEGTGKVVLNGIINQTVSTETFNILELNKSAQMLVPAGSSINCAIYDWTAGGVNISGGSLTALDLADDGIFGSYTLSSGTIEFTQDSAQYIDLRAATLNISGGTFRINGGGGALWMAYQGTTNFTMSGGFFDVRDQDILISSAYPVNETITGGFIRTTGDFTVQRTDFNPAGGYVELWGGTNAYVAIAAGSTLSTLVVNKTSTREDREFRLSRDGSRLQLTRANTVFPSGNINLGQNLMILNGVFDCSGYNVSISNDLTVNGQFKMTSGSFSAADNVYWNGGAQVSGGSITCGGEWTFGPSSTAELTGSTAVLSNPYGGILTNNSSVAGFGSLEINATEENPVCSYVTTSGTALRVAGALNLLGAVTLNLNQGSCQANSINIPVDCALIVGDGGSLEVQSTLSLAGSLNIGPGSVATHGFFSFPASGLISIEGGDFTNDAPWMDFRATFNLYGGLAINGGSFAILNNNVYLASHSIRTFNSAYLTFGRGFTATSAGAYQPVLGSLKLNGSNSSGLNVSGGNYIATLEVQKADGASVLLSANTLIQENSQIISGTLDLNGYSLSLYGDMEVDGDLLLNPSSALAIHSGKALRIRDGGAFQALGTSIQGVSVSRVGTSGYYAFEAQSGSQIAATFATFAHMNTNGIYIHSGAEIDPAAAFNHCTFQNGASGGYLLRVDNAQNLTLNGVVFPSNSWSGAGNVKKTVNSGLLTFIAYSGGFSGPAYESDPYSRINWQASGIMPVQNLHATRQNGANPILLTWEYPYPYTSFKIYAANSPDGTFSLVGTSTGLSWSGAVTSGKRFYRVTAIN